MPAHVIHEHALHPVKREEGKVGKLPFSPVDFLVFPGNKSPAGHYSPVIIISGHPDNLIGYANRAKEREKSQFQFQPLVRSQKIGI